MEEIFQLQSIFSVSLFLFEVPSGYISDLFGRKITLILAGLFRGFGMSLYLTNGGYTSLVGVMILTALAASFFSGTDLSLLYDSIKLEKIEEPYSKFLGKSVFYKQLAETFGGLVGGWLVLYSLDYPMYGQVIVAWFPLIFSLFIREPQRTKFKKDTHKENFKIIYNKLFKDSMLLNMLFVSFIVYGSATLIAVWVFQSYWESIHIPLAYFGYLWAVSNLIAAFIGKYSYVVERRLGSMVVLYLVFVPPFVGYIGMGWVESFWGVLFCFVFQISRGFNSVIIKDGFNKRVSEEMRATANSIASLGVRGVFVIAGPLLGYLIDHKGNKFAFTLFAIFYLFAFILLIKLMSSLRQQFKQY